MYSGKLDNMAEVVKIGKMQKWFLTEMGSLEGCACGGGTPPLGGGGER